MLLLYNVVCDVSMCVCVWYKCIEIHYCATVVYTLTQTGRKEADCPNCSNRANCPNCPNCPNGSTTLHAALLLSPQKPYEIAVSCTAAALLPLID